MNKTEKALNIIVKHNVNLDYFVLGDKENYKKLNVKTYNNHFTLKKYFPKEKLSEKDFNLIKKEIGKILYD